MKEVKMDDLLLSSIPLDKFLESIREIIKQEIFSRENYVQQEKLLSTTEACKLLNISSVTLGSWVKKEFIKKYMIGRRNLYKHSEILESLKTFKKYKTKF